MLLNYFPVSFRFALVFFCNNLSLFIFTFYFVLLSWLSRCLSVMFNFLLNVFLFLFHPCATILKVFGLSTKCLSKCLKKKTDMSKIEHGCLKDLKNAHNLVKQDHPGYLQLRDRIRT